MSEETINQLGNIANRILDVLRDFMKQVVDSLSHLKQLPGYVEDIRKDMNTGLTRVIQSGAEMEIYIRMAQISSRKTLISSEGDAINEFKQQLDYDFGEIDKRYSKIQNELNEECSKRIRAIDEILFSIPEKFPRNLYNSFSTEIMPLFENLRDDTRIAYQERVKAVTVAVDKSREKISAFINARNEFIKEIKDYQFQSDGDPVSTYYVPVWVAERQDDETNTITTHAFLPGEAVLTSSDLDVGDMLLTADERLKPYFQVLKDDALQKKLIHSVEWSENVKSQEELKSMLEQYLNYKYLNTYSAMKSAVVKSIEQSEIKFINM